MIKLVNEHKNYKNIIIWGRSKIMNLPWSWSIDFLVTIFVEFRKIGRHDAVVEYDKTTVSVE